MNLAAIGRLDILNALFGTIHVPVSVREELLAMGASASGAVDVGKVDWLVVRQVADQSMVSSLYQDLDVGEAEAIVLARELAADVVLMDERRGRRIAARLGLVPLGVLGALLAAKRRGIVPEIRPLVDQLVSIAGFWIGSDLYSRVLSEASE